VAVALLAAAVAVAVAWGLDELDGDAELDEELDGDAELDEDADGDVDWAEAIGAMTARASPAANAALIGGQVFRFTLYLHILV
jgi:hypothetical protein